MLIRLRHTSLAGWMLMGLVPFPANLLLPFLRLHLSAIFFILQLKRQSSSSLVGHDSFGRKMPSHEFWFLVPNLKSAGQFESNSDGNHDILATYNDCCRMTSCWCAGECPYSARSRGNSHLVCHRLTCYLHYLTCISYGSIRLSSFRVLSHISVRLSGVCEIKRPFCHPHSLSDNSPITERE